MKTISIIIQVTNPNVVKIIKEAKSKKAQIRELLTGGVSIADIPENLKIKVSK